MSGLRLALAACALAGAGAAAEEAATSPPPPPPAGASSVHLAQAWVRDLFGPSILPFPSDRDTRPPSDSDTWDAPPPAHRPPPAPAGTYGTFCVRLCDGFRAPVSYATTRARFQHDAARCEQSCPSRSRLFTLPTGSEDYAGMTDLKGEPYAALENAFRYQREYVSDCTCRGNPWDEASLARHRAYAVEDAARKSRQATRIGSAKRLQPHRGAGSQRTSRVYRPAGGKAQ